MSVTIDVGLSWVEAEDRSLVSWHVVRLNVELSSRGVAPISEAESLAGISSRARFQTLSSTALQTLRHVAMHRSARPSYKARPLGPAFSTFEDGIFPDTYTNTEHFLYHSDSEGFYVPRAFDEVISSDDVYGQDVGSSFHLRKELAALAPALDITLGHDGSLSDAEAERINEIAGSRGALSREHAAWIALYEAARLSIDHDALIVYH